MARYVRVTSISFAGAGAAGSARQKIKANLQRLGELIEEAATGKPDIICTPELCTVLGLQDKEWARYAQPVPGQFTQQIGKLCRKHNTYIIIGMPERSGRYLYNSSVLLGRDAKPVGSYHKYHPTIGELDLGIRPGTDYTVLQTEFGKVGFAICFDHNFRDVVEGAKANGAEILFFSSMYHGGLQNRIWASDFNLFFVSAYCGFGSRIVNPLGRVLAESQLHYPFVSQTINLDYVVCHIDYNNQYWKPLKEKYGDQVELEVMSYEARFILYSHHPEVSAADMAGEFNLRTLNMYWEMERKARAAALRRKTG